MTPKDTQAMNDNAPTQALDDFIVDIEGELRTGGGATLDELLNLALAIREDLTAIALQATLHSNKGEK